MVVYDFFSEMEIFIEKMGYKIDFYVFVDEVDFVDYDGFIIFGGWVFEYI